MVRIKTPPLENLLVEERRMDRRRRSSYLCSTQCLIKAHAVKVEANVNTISDVYRDSIRYKPETLTRIFEGISSKALRSPQRLVEIGVGTGYALEIASKVFLDAELVGVDVVPGMLEKADARKYQTQPRFFLTSAESINLPDKFSALTYSCCAFHLFQKKLEAASEMIRITEPGGLVAVIGYSHADLQSQVFHEYFPEFSRRELILHPEPSQISDIFTSLGATIEGTIREEFSVNFESPDEVVELIEERQFFGLRTMPDDVFELGKIEFEESFRNFYVNKPVVSVSALTATLFRV